MRTLNNIVKIMQEKNKKQKELTDYLGLSKNVFTDWKSGKCSSYQKYLPQIAEFLDVPIGYLTDEQRKEDDNLIKFAIFGTEDVTDEDMQQVKEFAKYLISKKTAKE